MIKHRIHASGRASLVEPLESRKLLSGSIQSAAPLCVAQPVSATTAAPAARVSAAAAAATRTTTKLTISKRNSTIGQPVVATVTVKAVGQKAAATGTVTITDNGANLDGSTDPLTVTLTKGKGGYFFGAGDLVLEPGVHHLQATYTSDASLPTSTSSVVTANVTTGKLTTLSDGVQTRTAIAGRGKAIKASQIANLYYTGYLTSTGAAFDYSALHSPVQPLSFTVGAGEVIPGFDEGVAGMKVGETRYIFIPSAQGYGATGSGTAIPPNSDLVFVVQLVSIGAGS